MKNSPLANNQVQLLAFIRFLESHQTTRDPNNASVVYCPGRFTWMSTETPRTALLEFVRLARVFAATELLFIELCEILDSERPIFVARKADNSAFQIIGDRITALDQSFADRAWAVVQRREYAKMAVRFALQFVGLLLISSIFGALFFTALPVNSSNPALAKLSALVRDFNQWYLWALTAIALLSVVHALVALIVRSRSTRAYFADPSNSLSSAGERA